MVTAALGVTVMCSTVIVMIYVWDIFHGAILVAKESVKIIVE